MSESALPDIPGGKALIDWFGRVPRFHDGELLEVVLSGTGKGTGLLRIHAWNMTDEVDAQGYVVLDKHAVVTLALEGVSRVDCTDFDMVPAIILDMQVTRSGEHVRVEWDASYGLYGSVTASHMQISFEPETPEQDRP